MISRNVLVHKLVQILKLKDEKELTPQYLSNFTASQLTSVGITPVAIVEIQEWLSHFKLSLKIKAPQNEDDVKKVKQAIAVLEVFQFDTRAVNEQLTHFLGAS